MDNVDDKDGLARLRIGCVLDKGAVRREARAAGIKGKLEGLCITTWVPASLLAALDTLGASVQQRLDVLDPPGAVERFVFLVVQVDAVQLRVVMPLSEQVVQQYLLDCARRGRIRLLLADETTKARAFIDLPGGFREPELALRIVREAQGLAGDPQMLLTVGQLLSPLSGVRSLITNTTVTDAVTVLVSNQEVDKVALRGAGLLTRRKSSLH